MDSEGHIKLDKPVEPREIHDKLDLRRDDLFNRPAYNVFTQCVKHFTPSITKLAGKSTGSEEDVQIRIGGEKALAMKEEMKGNPPTNYKPSSEILK
jgi:hypothetical protein